MKWYNLFCSGPCANTPLFEHGPSLLHFATWLHALQDTFAGVMEKNEFSHKILRLAIAAVMLAAGIICHELGVFGSLASNLADINMDLNNLATICAAVWFAATCILAGYPVFKDAWTEMLKGDIFSEFTLMSIAAVGAFCIGQYPEGVAVMLLYSIGELLQEKSVEKAKRNIKALLDVRPDSARVIVKKVNVANCLTKEESEIAGEHLEATDVSGYRILLPSQVTVGEVIEVRPGERVPLDGILLYSSSSSSAVSLSSAAASSPAAATALFNTSALTGESIPRRSSEGEEVMAGFISTESTVQIKVTRPAEESAVSRILKMVEEATERKAPTELFIRKFARIYTPVVIALAALIIICPAVYSAVSNAAISSATSTSVSSAASATAAGSAGFHFVFSGWLYRALIFLVISCPCALVISIPLGYFAGIGAASRRGILFKGSNYLDAIAKVNTVLFDKTGTLTKGVFEVQEVACTDKNDRLTQNTMVQLVAAMERESSHPVAKAIISYAEKIQNENEDCAKAENIREVAGRGVEAIINSSRILCGNLRMMKENGIAYPVELEDSAKTIVCCAAIKNRSEANSASADSNTTKAPQVSSNTAQISSCTTNNCTLLGYILLSDTPKDDAKKAIGELNNEGITETVILSGDKSEIVSELAKEIGAKQSCGDLLPEGKVEYLRKLSENKEITTAFVGDGINDAPVLATANVGIAMGGLGSDAAVETADIVIQTDQPSKVAEAVKIGRATQRIITQNIVMALGVKFAVMALGAAGYVSLWAAVFADSGVALLAVANSMRIRMKQDDGRSRT